MAEAANAPGPGGVASAAEGATVADVEGTRKRFYGTRKENHSMKIAIPTAGGRLCAHFGHCEQFVLVDIDIENKRVQATNTVTPPPHEPGLLPRWLHERGATLIIAGGMGQRAQQLFAQNRIAVVVGAPAETPDALVEAYLSGTLQIGDNTCDH